MQSETVTGAAKALQGVDLPPLTYLSFDSALSGVGASQVTPYLERLTRRGLEVSLHSYEKVAVDEQARARFAEAGIRWHPHRFRSLGAAGGALRAGHAAALLRDAELVHARSDLAAASAMLARRPRWLWDVRSFWIDERIAMGLVTAGSPEERVMRLIERQAARRSKAIITLTKAAIPVLAERHGRGIAAKVRVVPTCVDLSRFAVSPMPDPQPLRVLMSGSFNPLYDLDACVRLVRCLRRRRKVELTVLTPDTKVGEALTESVDATVGRVPFADMPEQVSRHHVGLGMWKKEAGVGLRAAAPTKLAEFLASGRVVVVSAGLGDMEELVATYDCGTSVADASEAAIERASDEIERLVDDPGVAIRCRHAAEQHFDLDRAVDVLVDAYRQAVQS